MKIPLYLFFVLCFVNSMCYSEVCKRCEEIREYNRQHPENNYEFYDDYLKDQERKKTQPTQTQANEPTSFETKKNMKM